MVSLQEAMRQLERVTGRLSYRTPRLFRERFTLRRGIAPGLQQHLLPCRDHGG